MAQAKETARSVLHKELLRRRGLHMPTKKKLVPGYPVINKVAKSPLMLVLEDLYGRPIEQLVFEDKIAVLAEKWHVDETTVSKWRTKFKG